MSVTVVSELFGGIDVSKKVLDVGLRDPAGACVFGCSVSNDARGIGRLKRQLKDKPVRLFVVESTGGYEQAVVDELSRCGQRIALVNPLRTRRFAQSIGQEAKTDSIDRQVLSEYARQNERRLRVERVRSDNEKMLKELTCRRRQLVEQASTAKNHREHATLQTVRQSIDRTIKHLCQEIKVIEEQIQSIIDADETMKKRQEILLSVKGIGVRVSRILISELPELGQIDRKKIASLVGVAPFNDESGDTRNPPSIRGGRATVRAALYMSTLVATRNDDHIRAYYQRLCAAGKPKKVALVACMRKRLNYLTSLLSEKPKSGGEPK